MIRIANSGIVCNDGGLRSRTSPSVCVLPNGRWLCGFRAARRKTAVADQNVALVWSDDEGATWTRPVTPFTAPAIDDKPGALGSMYLTHTGGGSVTAVIAWIDISDPDLPFFNEVTEGLLDTRILVSHSDDHGRTWSDLRIVPTPFDQPTPITGQMLHLRNRNLVCQYELNKTYYDPGEWKHSSVLMFSEDGGVTWTSHTTTSDPDNRIFYWDQRPGVLANGDMLSLFWTYDKSHASYLSIHARESLDNGRTWSEIWDTGVPGQPAQPVSLSDGRIAAVFVDRRSNPAIKMRLSEDRGRTWPEAGEIVVYEADIPSQTLAKTNMQDTLAEQAKFTIGLPSTTCTDNGDVLIVFYAGTSVDDTGIRWARVNTERLDVACRAEPKRRVAGYR